MSFETKITVVKVLEPKDIIGEDFILDSGEKIPKCPFFSEGDEFIVNKWGEKPEKFCQFAFYSISKFVDVLRLGGGYDDWTGKDTLYGVCHDGIRPVCFKIQRLENKEKEG
ncbi:MAG: TIGR04076 family protein [Candidatus Heimdallarchaeota archaeon]|nr:TIGR04076 family protein [Candidatus Heimdallarchaeota archaeon]MCG3252320.1 TIGR04076 family protein [Candidatus Heimdallarchaeota archaeon]MCK4289458.1 TIGR04076 family protein [Candidatus Heimdallarchaeota archaeon]